MIPELQRTAESAKRHMRHPRKQRQLANQPPAVGTEVPPTTAEPEWRPSQLRALWQWQADDTASASSNAHAGTMEKGPHTASGAKPPAFFSKGGAAKPRGFGRPRAWGPNFCTAKVWGFICATRKKKRRSRPISRVLSWTVILLGAASPRRSSNLPGPDAGSAMRSLFGLAPGGVCRTGPLPDSRCALTAPFHPYRPACADVGGIFLLHFPSARAAQALPGTLPYGARTFLGIALHRNAPRRRDCLADSAARIVARFLVRNRCHPPLGKQAIRARNGFPNATRQRSAVSTN
jgi:hypothetical protein